MKQWTVNRGNSEEIEHIQRVVSKLHSLKHIFFIIKYIVRTDIKVTWQQWT